MSSVREHLASMHERTAAHHIEKSKYHTGMAKHFSKLAECVGKAEMNDGDAGECLSGIAELHKGMAAHHADEAEVHVGHAKELARTAKAMGAGMSDADLDKVMPLPSGMSMVAPNAPNIRSVPRGGQPQPLARANVPIEFSHLVKVSDDE